MSRIKVPFPLRSDAYTISSEAFAGPKAKELSVYNLVMRRGPSKVEELSPICTDDRMVFYGLSDYIGEHLTTPITHADIDEAAAFMKSAHSFGGPLPFPEELWRRVVAEFDGLLPITIVAIPEGSVFYPGEPCIQVISEPEFGELAAFIEPLMVGMVSCATARATISRHWLDACRNEIMAESFNKGKVKTDCWLDLTQEQRDEIDMTARFMIHDFGMRASSCAEESELLGRAHLLSFHGTDTFNAAYQAWKMGAKRPTGTSILALAHRIVQGHDLEGMAFLALKDAAKLNVPVASYVSDCYNFQDGLDTLAGIAIGHPDETFVCRPDSGDYIQNVIDIVSKGIPNLRFINGDSMTPYKIHEIWDALQRRKLPITSQGIFGVGGFLRNTANRDIFSAAYKLAARGLELEPVCKLSETKDKRSVPGLVTLNGIDESPTVGVAKSLEEVLGSDYQLFYSNGVVYPYARERFDVIQDRCLTLFDEHYFTESRSNNDGVWDMNIMAIQQEYEDKYRS